MLCVVNDVLAPIIVDGAFDTQWDINILLLFYTSVAWCKYSNGWKTALWELSRWRHTTLSHMAG